MLSFEQQNQNSSAHDSPQQSQSQPQMRLRDEIPQINQPAQRNGRKRKSPPTNPETPQPPPPPQPQQQQPPPQSTAPHNLQHVLPAHLMAHPFPFAGPAPGTDYTPAGIPPQPGQPGPPPEAQQQQPPQQQQSPTQQTSAAAAGGRALSNSKRAEQNRKAQRAFRERRDQHVKALESRSQLLDAALASADEANRRWEECRALVDQLRVENATLRAALSQHVQVLPIPPVIPGQEHQAPKGEGENKPESGEGVKSG
ncbi:hypothetical protein VNI00_011813 [Paramarasmius palmivorus]|uniref:BZIP domain-containing protein n=1 Tax=Paramarasmius palmivorus TaxID=297713 RepID=A0AAW0C831_9AGAR